MSNMQEESFDEERIKSFMQAAQNVRYGKVFPLNWNLESPSPPLFGRTSIEHHIRDRSNDAKKFDDVYDNFNTQSSSQWDGLRHVCHMSSGRFYNDVIASHIVPGPGASDRLGIHHAARRGIAGRAVLLDYARWADWHDKQFDPLTRHEYTVGELEQVAAEQNVELREGDILLVRTGWIAAYEKRGDRLAEMMDLTKPQCVGIKACQETFRWIWDHHFAAVASDSVAFEAFPVHDWNTSCRKSLERHLLSILGTYNVKKMLNSWADLVCPLVKCFTSKSLQKNRLRMVSTNISLLVRH